MAFAIETESMPMVTAFNIFFYMMTTEPKKDQSDDDLREGFDEFVHEQLANIPDDFKQDSC